MTYRLAIFDLDGTLADSFPWFLPIVNSVADKHRFRRIDAGEIEDLRGKGTREVIRHLQVPMWRIPLIARGRRRRIDRAALRGQSRPGHSGCGPRGKACTGPNHFAAS